MNKLHLLAVTCIHGSVRIINDEVDRINQLPEFDFVQDDVARGRVEVCVENNFGSVCDLIWNHLDASIVCDQLGFSPYGKYVI